MRSSHSARDPGDVGIGDAARRCGVTAHVLRHWESVGLLAPRRDAAGRRRYGGDDVAAVAAILLAKRAGLSLDRLRDYLAADRATRRDLLVEHLAALRSRIDALQDAAGATAEALAAVGSDDPGDCTRYGYDAIRIALGRTP